MATTKKNRFWTWLWNDENKNVDDSKQKTSQVQSKSNLNNSTASSSNIAKAREAFFEIESLIQRELSLLNTDDDEDDAQLIRTNKSSSSRSHQDIAKATKGKRPGPKLIKPLNKKKNKMVLGSMVYDPTNNVWVGNDEELSVFGRGSPSLITNSEQTKKGNIKVGDMTFDPVEGVWRGNEQDLTKFGPSLISQPKPLSEPIVHGSMIFDPETMTWKGNDEDVDIFEDIEIVDSKKGFKVGDEFTLTPDLVQLFQLCEEQHNRLLSGWFSTEYDKTGRNHLSAIRSMSIIKIINQAKTSTLPIKKDDKSQNGSPAKFTVTKLNKKPIKTQHDDWDDVSLPSTGKITLKQSRSRSSSISSVDWDSNDDSGTANSTVSDNSLAKFQDDDDFDDLDINDIKLKKFASPSKQFTDAEKDNVLDVQPGKNGLDNSQEIWEDSDSQQEDTPVPALRSTNLQQPISTFVDEDDWDDVDISALPVRPSVTLSKSKGPTNTAKKSEDSDFSDGLEFSTNSKLTLRPRALSTAERNEEEWSDIEIPSALVLQPKNPNIIKK